MYLQSVERYTEKNKTGYKAIYSNGLDFNTLLFPIKDKFTVINIPTIVKSVMTAKELKLIGADNA